MNEGVSMGIKLCRVCGKPLERKRKTATSPLMWDGFTNPAKKDEHCHYDCWYRDYHKLPKTD